MADTTIVAPFPSGVATTQFNNIVSQNVPFLLESKTINVANISSPFDVFSVKKGLRVLKSTVIITTVFNAGAVDIGYVEDSTDVDGIHDTTDITEATVDRYEQGVTTISTNGFDDGHEFVADGTITATITTAVSGIFTVQLLCVYTDNADATFVSS